jgi:uncharacterized iron-regulated membrane protein
MKNKTLNQWLWKWHVIAGLISVPFIVLLAITGAIYLFNTDYLKTKNQAIVHVEASGNPISYQQQLETANSTSKKPHVALILSTSKEQATQFTSGRFGKKKSTYINPYTNTITGKIAANEGLMYKIRKLHGELLLGSFGTRIVELIASWMVVLLITGIFIWWPARGWRLQGFFIPRFKNGKQVLYRDLHAITAFWISGLLLLTLAGAFPWTDVFGENFKQLQKITGTGYPKTWQGIGFNIEKEETTITLDDIVKKAQALNLPGEVTINFPKGPKGVYSVTNSYHKDLNLQKNYHYNPYSGDLVLQQNWEDVGVLMRGRMWVMAFHQGQFGNWNWWLMLGIALFLAISTITAMVSYFSKQQNGKWVLPNVPKSFVVSKFVITIIVLLGLVFPLFGISVILIYLIETYKLKTKKAIK